MPLKEVKDQAKQSGVTATWCHQPEIVRGDGLRGQTTRGSLSETHHSGSESARRKLSLKYWCFLKWILKWISVWILIDFSLVSFILPDAYYTLRKKGPKGVLWLSPDNPFGFHVEPSVERILHGTQVSSTWNQNGSTQYGTKTCSSKGFSKSVDILLRMNCMCGASVDKKQQWQCNTKQKCKAPSKTSTLENERKF